MTEKIDNNDCLKMRQRIERFYQIIRKDFVENILHIERLGRQQFQQQQLRRKSDTNCKQLQNHFPRLDNKNQICQYQDQYCLGRSNQQFLLVNGMIRSNDYFDQCMDILCEQYEIFYNLMSECHLTMLLMIQPFHNRNISDHQLLMAMIETFDAYRNFAINQQQSIRSTLNAKRSNLLIQIATYPQYDDIRQIFIHYEQHQFSRIIRDYFDQIYYGYHYVYDIVIKNGNILAPLLRHSYDNN